MASYPASPGLMLNPRPNRPRAPAEASVRMSSNGRGENPRAMRCRFRAYPRSGAVSASVPSRSKRMALIMKEAWTRTGGNKEGTPIQIDDVTDDGQAENDRLSLALGREDFRRAVP